MNECQKQMKGPSSRGSRKCIALAEGRTTSHKFNNATNPNTTKPPAVIDVSSQSSMSQTTRNDEDLESEDDEDVSLEYNNWEGVSTFQTVLMILVTITTILPATQV